MIAAFLYLRIMISMWVTEPESGDDGREAVRVPLWTGVALTLSVGFTLVVGFFPGWLIDAANSRRRPQVARPRPPAVVARSVAARRPDDRSGAIPAVGGISPRPSEVRWARDVPAAA